MAGTFTKIYLQIIFAVKGRHALLDKSWHVDLCKYISGIITEKKNKPIIVNGHRDHIHAFIGYKPSIPLPDLVRDMKSCSTAFINDNKFVRGKFSWQEGYGAFSYSHSHIDRVYKYVLNQEEHHKKLSFKEEYLSLLKKFNIPFEERYLFDWID